MHFIETLLLWVFQKSVCIRAEKRERKLFKNSSSRCLHGKEFTVHAFVQKNDVVLAILAAERDKMRWLCFEMAETWGLVGWGGVL